MTTIFQQFDRSISRFTPAEGFHLGAGQFRFATIGNRDEPVVVQLRSAVQGQPDRTVLAEAVIDMHAVNTWVIRLLHSQTFRGVKRALKRRLSF